MYIITLVYNNLIKLINGDKYATLMQDVDTKKTEYIAYRKLVLSVNLQLKVRLRNCSRVNQPSDLGQASHCQFAGDRIKETPAGSLLLFPAARLRSPRSLLLISFSL